MRRRFIFLLAGGIGLLLLMTGGAQTFDRGLDTFGAQLRSHPASGEIHIVELDARSISAVGRWPWPRSVHGAAVDRLRQSGARLVAFDVDFSSASDLHEDARFAAALKRAGGSVILPTFRQQAGSGHSDYIDAAPIPALAAHAFLAAANVVPGPDGYLRQMPEGVETLGTPRPSLAAMVAERPARVGVSFEVDDSIEPATIPRHSMIDLLEGRVPPSKLAGKRIIIGATAVELGDRYAVPRHGVLPGVVIQAMAAETLLQGPPPLPGSGFWALGLALLVVALSLRLASPRGRIGFLVAGAGAIVLLSFFGGPALGATLPAGAALATLIAAGAAGAAAHFMERYRDRALTDAQTKLPNLAALEAAAEGKGALSIGLARIGGFAELVSAFGSDVAAQLVLRVAERLRFVTSAEAIYRVDDTHLAWIDGAEEDPAERLEPLSALMRAPLGTGAPIDVQLHFGLARGGGGEARQLIANAAIAAADAAKQGLRWQVFTQRHSEDASWMVALSAELDAAIACEQLWLAYQPKLDLRTGDIAGVEALVRWNHPERGALPPDRFIPLIEEQGRAGDLTLYVMEKALAEGLRWERDGHPLSIAVNVSATLLHDESFMHRLGQVLGESGFPTERLILEVTESAAMADPQAAVTALQRWRGLGVGISIDDYGTGQSSLNYLQKLPATEIKIDKSFVQNIVEDGRDAIMVRSTIAMAHELGLKVIAEGIEDLSCLALLREMGCDFGQGYHIGRPMAGDALLNMVTASRAPQLEHRSASA